MISVVGRRGDGDYIDKIFIISRFDGCLVEVNLPDALRYLSRSFVFQIHIMSLPFGLLYDIYLLAGLRLFYSAVIIDHAVPCSHCRKEDSTIFFA